MKIKWRSSCVARDTFVIIPSPPPHCTPTPPHPTPTSPMTSRTRSHVQAAQLLTRAEEVLIKAAGEVNEGSIYTPGRSVFQLLGSMIFQCSPHDFRGMAIWGSCTCTMLATLLGFVWPCAQQSPLEVCQFIFGLFVFLEKTQDKTQSNLSFTISIQFLLGYDFCFLIFLQVS